MIDKWSNTTSFVNSPAFTRNELTERKKKLDEKAKTTTESFIINFFSAIPLSIIKLLLVLSFCNQNRLTDCEFDCFKRPRLVPFIELQICMPFLLTFLSPYPQLNANAEHSEFEPKRSEPRKKKPTTTIVCMKIWHRIANAINSMGKSSFWRPKAKWNLLCAPFGKQLAQVCVCIIYIFERNFWITFAFIHNFSTINQSEMSMCVYARASVYVYGYGCLCGRIVCGLKGHFQFKNND